MAILKVANVHFNAGETSTIGANGANVVVRTSNAERLRVQGDGNVAIGKTNASYKLDVDGTINASAILVNGSPISGGSGAATFSANIGNNSATVFNVTHSLNKVFVVPAVREISSGYYVFPDIKYVNANTISVEFRTAPTANQYCVIVLG